MSFSPPLPLPLMGVLSLMSFLCILCLTPRNLKKSFKNWRSATPASQATLRGEGGGNWCVICRAWKRESRRKLVADELMLAFDSWYRCLGSRILIQRKTATYTCGLFSPKLERFECRQAMVKR